MQHSNEKKTKLFKSVFNRLYRLLEKRYWFWEQGKATRTILKKLFSIRLVQYLLLCLFILFLFPFSIFFLLRPTTPEVFNYGTTFSHKYATALGLDWQETYLAILDDLGVKNLRLTVYWDETEPERDHYDFSIVKWQLGEAAKRNIPVILITGRKVVRYPECFEPPWWEAIADESERDNELYEFVQESVAQLVDYDNIVMWQVENEPFFPFGDCAGEIKTGVLQKEIELVRTLDDRPILVQDSGEGGYWLPSYLQGDYLAISMYRRIWYDFWGVFFGKFIYFQYPLSHWTYRIKAGLLLIPPDRILVTELQAEPWGPAINSELSRQEKDKTMSKTQFIDTINYAQKAGFKDLYFWGAEWWYLEQTQLNEPFYWDTAKALFRTESE